MTRGMGMENIFMHDINHSIMHCELYECGCCDVPLHVHFRWVVALVGEFNYRALLTSSWDPLFRCSGRRHSLEAEIMKRAELWP